MKTVPWSVGENMELFTVVASCQVEKDGPMVNTIKHAGHAILQAGYGEENVHKLSWKDANWWLRFISHSTSTKSYDISETSWKAVQADYRSPTSACLQFPWGCLPTCHMQYFFVPLHKHILIYQRRQERLGDFNHLDAVGLSEFLVSCAMEYMVRDKTRIWSLSCMYSMCI